MSDRKIILAIDDMSENLSRMRSLLEGYFDMRLAKSGKLALKLLENTHVDLILLDIEMPIMSGFDFLKQLRATRSVNKDVPVIFITAHADADLITQAINCGAKDYVLKPVAAESLYKKIDSVIGMPDAKSAFNPIEEKAKHLLSIVSSGDSARIDIILTELVNMVRSQGINIRRFVEDIEKHIQNFDYDKAGQKIKEFMMYLSFSRNSNKKEV